MTPITIAAATPADSRDLFEWQNDPDTRRVSKSSAPIDWVVHTAWFADALASRDRTIYIGYCGSKKIGCIRFDRIRNSDERFLISIVIAPAERGRGYGAALLRAGIAALPNTKLEAEIATENLASQRVFEACGFERIFDQNDGSFPRYRRSPDAQSEK